MATEALKPLMEKADKAILGLPEFQRDFVWKTSQVIKLITSLLNGYPIGGLLFMEDEKAYGFRPLDGAPEGSLPQERILVLDGQQRLTSCYQAFYGAVTAKANPGRYYFKYREYLENPKVTGSDVEDLIEFLPKRKVDKELKTVSEEHAAGLFPLDIIFRSRGQVNSYKWLSDFSFSEARGDPEKYDRLSQSQAHFIQTFVEQITGYQIHYEEIRKKTSPDVICTVFETINTTGKRLTVFDLLVARCYVGGVRLRDLLDSALAGKQLIRQFDPEGEDLCTVALPRIIGLLSKGSCKRGDLLSLDADTIRTHWDNAVNATEVALHVLVERFGAFSLRFVPLLDTVAPMAVILTHRKYQEAGRKAEALLSNWYWRSVFSQYFVTSGETKAARAVKEWGVSVTEEKGWLDDEQNEPESVKNFNWNKSLLRGVARQDDAVYRGVMSMLLAHGVLDLKSPQQLLTQRVVDQIEDHHVFPQKYLAPQGIKGAEANQIANRTPILDETNRTIRNDAPHQYLNDSALVGAGGLDADILEKHLIPGWLATEATFSRELYNRFIAERQALLLKEIADLVVGQPVDDEDR